MSTSCIIRSAAAGLVLAATSALVPFAASPASAQGSHHAVTVTVRPSRDGGGTADYAGSYDPVLSANGRYVAFEAVATGEVYVQDLLTGQSELVSKTPAGQPANGSVSAMGISADGNRILFMTGATNLSGGLHTAHDLYVRDRRSNQVSRVNWDPNKVGSEVYDYQATMDASGNTIAWVGQDAKVWVRHLFYPGKTERVDVSSAEVAANDTPFQAAISADGAHVVFASYATNLVANDKNGFPDVFERSLSAGTTVRASLGGNSAESKFGGRDGSVSKDGRYVAFTSESSDLVPNDKNLDQDVFVHDLVTHTTERASLGATSIETKAESTEPRISGDGHTVLFRTSSNNLYPGQTGHHNWFVRNLTTHVTTAADVSIGGKIGDDEANREASISGDGSVVAFVTKDDNLIEGDTNTSDDVYVRMPESMGPHVSLSKLAAVQLADFDGAAGTSGAHTSDLTNGRVTVAHYIATLAHDPAWAKDREPIIRLYNAFFDRQPDLAGLNYWVAKHAKGTDLSVIATKFAQSSEFKTKYGSVDDAGFVKLVYQNVLGRTADAAGLSHWVAQMGSGMSRGGVMTQFSESAEGKRDFARQTESTLIGIAMFHKIPAWTDFVAGTLGYTESGPEGVALAYLDSAAYYARY